MISDVAKAAPSRNILIGRNSYLWRKLAARPVVAGSVSVAIGHAEVEHFAFSQEDRVWVFAYSRKHAENQQLLERLSSAGVARIYYVSSSSAIVARVTRCYEYPTVKAAAEKIALQIPAGFVVTLGLVYEDPAELPAGENVATSIAELADFICRPDWPDSAGRCKLLFRAIRRPFTSNFEAALYCSYDRLLRACGQWPCLLRPLDVALRVFGYRWYGYVRLSNRLWYSTISS